MKEDKVMTIIGALIAVLALLMFSVGRFIMGGIVLLLAFGVFYNRGFGKANDRSIYENVVKSDLSIDEIYAKVRDIETPLGKAWIAEHKGFEGDSIVFGPNAFKDCVVISKKKNKIDIKHITLLDNIIRKAEDEYRFKDFINSSDAEVTPKRYAIFASFKIASVVMIRELREFIEKLSACENATLPEHMGIYKFYYHNSLNGVFKDGEENEILKVEDSYSPFVARVLDDEGNEMASIKPHSINAKGGVNDASGYELIANGEHFGEIVRKSVSGSDTFIAKTEAGEFEIKIFPACTRANVSCNYTVRLDGELKAVIGGSPNIVFDEGGQCQSDIVLSYDDDYLVLYAVMEIFIMTLNRKFLK